MADQKYLQNLRPRVYAILNAFGRLTVVKLKKKKQENEWTFAL